MATPENQSQSKKSQSAKGSSKKAAVQTTGHAWDGDIQEFNNPLPNWWVWGFYATIVFTIIYWVLYPAWPVGRDYTKGVMNDIEYTTADGKTVKTHWNTRALHEKDLQQARAEQQQYLDQLASASIEDIAKDEEKSKFAYSMAKVLFADNCAACHQTGGAGVVGSYPNLADDDWLWGGNVEQIKTSITAGRKGYMPSFKASLNDTQIEDVAEYVLSLSKHKTDAAKTARGKAIFNGQSGGCYYCHTKAGSGMVSMGSANLTDSVWTLANIPAAEDLNAKKDQVETIIRNGVNRKMPAWNERLTDTQIKILSFYVHQLGGGK